MKGLSTAEVQKRIQQGQVNKTDQSSQKSFGQICRENIFTYFNLIFLVIAILIFMTNRYQISDFLFLPVVIINALVGIYQEWRSQKTLSKLTIVSAPQVTVIRDNQETKVAVDQLVVDDIMRLGAGDQITVDASLVDGSLSTDESILTGEADEIAKHSGDKLFSGSYVVSGDGFAKVTKVGEETYASQLVSEARKTHRDDKGAMVRSIDHIILLVGIIIIPLGIAMVYQSMVIKHESFATAVNGMVAAVIGMIPEGLYLLVTVALATSAVRLARRKVLLHNMQSIEQLSRVDTLCIDKTGTITEPEMQVTDLIPVGTESKEALQSLIAHQVGQLEPDNQTMKAIQKAFPDQQSGNPATRVIPFKSANKYSALVYPDQTYYLGAPENLLLDNYQQYAKLIEPYQNKGYRVLAFGQRAGQPSADGPLDMPITPLAMIVLQNPVRKNAPDTFKYFAKQGVAVKVISGDNPQTVSAVATAADIENADRYVDARTLKTTEQIEEAANSQAIFGRVTPDMKRQLVKSLQKGGHTVAMTGDGVNDILAMKTADCSVAMASGSSAAMNAASIVLLQSDFSTMPKIVAEGRRTINNIQRSASLFLIKNIFSFFLALLTLITALDYPLRSSQISLISAFMIGIPGYLLTLEPDTSPIKGHFTRTVFMNALPAALVDVFSIGMLMYVGELTNMKSVDVSTVSALIIAFVGIAMLVYLSRPLTVIRGATIVISAVGFILAITLMGDFFRFVTPSIEVVTFGLVFLLAAEAILIDFRWLNRWIVSSFHHRGKH